MKTLYQKLHLLLNEIKSIEGLDLKQEKTVYNEEEINAMFKGKIDNETNIEVFIKLNPIPKY
ncbi:hypothetical protein UFOVP899_9 [uncultured Caudovirales phage]|jgi:hypothetical protein|uniref:Uncharacterized protein n=1 Tax=uncultured Caudovirales phage TaxID=2100421 RepID=A0A6J7XHH8_9CAUD|nr:hypothetical protein UFOVP899_9 [uncultured Caudovirales phage]CAB4176112.1 hypothetical protein UFOVP987_8 [uncultured Caudovirales phage]CAB4180921.1 hypothetical protein UFOVP1074_29 [uncultured Caudovirales phage]CAB4198273.1 hypothetical protein UFOVP1310_52 [uncultured Caudovirales phage]CAB4210482.1 hypothetical protein UFOVP1424_20 [uncultured Caudovirales phage]